MGILIYERNVWPEIVAAQHPRYAVMNNFTISVEIEEGPVADSLEKDPLLHQKLIDNVNAFVNDTTVKVLNDNVYRTETDIQIQINTSDFDGLAHAYREFDVFTRYLLAVTNDNTQRIVQSTIDTQVKDKRAATRYKAGIVIKLSYRIGSLLFSTGTLAIGTTSAIVTAGTTAIPGLIVGFIGLVQAAAELGRELGKTISSMETAGADALVTLDKMVKKYNGAGATRIGVREVGHGVVNKVFSGFVELDTISTLSGKFGLWESKILVVDQNTHRLAKKLQKLFIKMDEIQKEIKLAQRPPVPSRVGCALKVPPLIPSRHNRPTLATSRPTPPPIPSRQGRVSGLAMRDTLGLRTPPPVPSRLGRPPLNPAPQDPPTLATKRGMICNELGCVQSKTLPRLRGKVNTSILKISELQKEVNKNKFLNSHYKGTLDRLKGKKTKAVAFVESFSNVTLGIGKSGLSLGLGGWDLANGIGTVNQTVHSIGSFVVEQSKEVFDLSLELTDEFGELSDKLRDKERLNQVKMA